MTAAAANFSGVVTFAGSTQVGSAGALGVGAAATASSSLTVNCGITNKIEVMTAGTYNCISLNGVNSGINTMSGIFGGSTGDVGALYIEAPTSISGRIGSSIITTTNTSGLGIGMTPSNVLDITQNQNGNSVVAILNSDGGASATTRYRLRNGTTTSEFQLFGSGFTPTGVYRANGLLVENSGAGGVTINAAAAQPIYFGINSSEVARFDTSGSLLVGTTSNATTSRAVFRNTQNVLALDNSGGQYTTMTFCNNNTATAYVYYDNTNSRLYVQTGASGGVYLAATGTSWTAVSDERVKDIIEPIENATDKLAGWRTVIGKYKTDKDGVRRSFLIAQDILKTFPEAVDATEPDEYGVNYQDTIPVLVAAIQELTTRLAALENK
jgi:hypothetical protein